MESLIYTKYNYTHTCIEDTYQDVLEYGIENISEYYDTVEYSDTMFIINSCSIFQRAIDWVCRYCKEYYPNVKRIIYYDFEQCYIHNKYLILLFYDKIIENQKTIESYGMSFELWTYNPLNLNYYKKLLGDNINAKFVPLRYCESLKYKHKQLLDKRVNLKKEFFFGFIGEIFNEESNYRYSNLQKIYHTLSVNDRSILIISRCKVFLNDLDLNSKYVCGLNLHQYDENSYQEQIRIAPLLQSGIPVISEKSHINFFGDLILEYDFSNYNADDFYQKVDEYLDRVSNIDLSEEFKQMTVDNYNEYVFNIEQQYNKVIEENIYV